MADLKDRFLDWAQVPLVVIWALAGPVTYILNVVDTWQGNAAVWLKLLINLTLDAFLAAIWPITWTLWLVMRGMGKSTPLDLLF